MAGSRCSIRNITKASQAVLQEVLALYGNASSTARLSGIYLPQELSNGMCQPGKPSSCTVCCANCTCCFGPEQARQEVVTKYLRPLAQQVKRFNKNIKVWTAPDAYLERACPPLWAGGCNSRCTHGLKAWCGTPEGTFMPPEQWAEWWRKTLAVRA